MPPDAAMPSARAALFEFEGEQLTITQIHARVPALSPSCIRSHLRAGRTTRQSMLTFNVGASLVRNGRKAALRKRKADAESEKRQTRRRAHLSPLRQPTP